MAAVLWSMGGLTGATAQQAKPHAEISLAGVFSLVAEGSSFDLSTPDRYPARAGLHSGEAANALPSIMFVWLRGDREAVENAWFRNAHRPARVFALALFLTAESEPENAVEERFRSYARRYGEEEARQRLEEIDWVATNRAAVAEALKRMYETKLGKEPKVPGWSAVARLALGVDGPARVKLRTIQFSLE